MKVIKKLKLKNFKRFEDFEVDFTPNINLIIGDNEAGKSTILTALELVISGSAARVESIGLENIFSMSVIKNFLSSSKEIDKLPTIHVEIYLEEQNYPNLYGNYNLDKKDSDGLQLICEPNESLLGEISSILSQSGDNFPFELYDINFSTFAGIAFSGYSKYFRYIAIDSTQINNEYATRRYISNLYESLLSPVDRSILANEYRQQKISFKDNSLHRVNNNLSDYEFSIRSNPRSNLDTDLTIVEGDIPIEHKGKGKQCFVKTEFALSQPQGKSVNTILLEEPENHLSHISMKKLINRISASSVDQIFIATHSSLVSTRLDLRKSILLNSNSRYPVTLKDIPEDTAKFFMKAPNNNILEFILSKKVILVEGDAEFILLEAFYKKCSQSTPDVDDVHILSVGGTSFKRYLDLAEKLGIKTAVIRDNDGDYNKHCLQRYRDYLSSDIEVFYDSDNKNETFEICLYNINKKLCDQIFSSPKRTLPILDYMLKNKADSAFKLLDERADEINIPVYIEKAIQWIRG